MEGTFICLSRSDDDSAIMRHLRLIADVAFVYVVALYLIFLYFSIVTTSIVKNTNEFMGNEDFYISGLGQ